MSDLRMRFAARREDGTWPSSLDPHPVVQFSHSGRLLLTEAADGMSPSGQSALRLHLGNSA